MATQHEIFNYFFQTKLNSWTPLVSAHHGLFSEEERALLERSNRTFLSAKRTIVMLSFENRFASLGGLGAVVRQFPAALKENGERLILLTPLQANSSAVQKAVEAGELAVRCSGLAVRICNFSCTASCYEEVGAAFPTFHIGIDGRFTAGDNPYGYADKEDLLFDSLAFCSVVPSMLEHLGFTEHLLFHAHDWETAPIAVFSRFSVISSVLKQACAILTLHNSFDAPFSDHLKIRFFNKNIPGYTVLQCMLPFFHGPLTSVSTPFAYELRHDPLQRGFFTDHLQDLFKKNPPIGIENGMFGNPRLPFTEPEIEAAKAKKFKPMLTKKTKWRTSFLTALRKMDDERIIGGLSTASLDDPTIPVFFMSGRFDLMQKGFDTLFTAFGKLPAGSAHLFFSPTLHNDNDDLSFFRDIADQCRGSIVICPFFIPSDRYRAFLQGASFLLMPSLYEPFGAASEGFLHGTPVVARATGGLLAQIHPGSDFLIPPLYSSLFPGSFSDSKNGILYRENYPDSEAEKLWRSLLTAPLPERTANPLYHSIADAGYHALQEACTTFRNQQLYGDMIYNGLMSVQQHSWDLTVAKYRSVYNVTAVRGG